MMGAIIINNNIVFNNSELNGSSLITFNGKNTIRNSSNTHLKNRILNYITRHH